MRLLDKTWLTEDEAFNAEGFISDQLECALNNLKLDTYNHQYVVRVTVDQVNPAETQEETDEDDMP